jgi:hypothetical protein
MRDDGKRPNVEMTEIFGLLIAANIVSTVILWTVLAKERKRNRVLGAFIAGIVRSISNYVSTTDSIDSDELPPRYTQLPIPYINVLEAIEYELSKNFYISPAKYERWLIKTRQLFLENETIARDARNDGFIFMTYDLFDDLLARWRSSELMTKRQKEYLSEEVVVTKENVTELQGEIAMYEDLMAGKITLETPEAANIDNRLAVMLSHLKQTYRNNLRDKLLGDRFKASPDKAG